ncbi:uncharacterized protein LOC134706822 [Mytilus trossulus]|uniref:uncharacterized protein LOC134706822 n=1 Tax=Mytilus trossulus TaxID=6551 RepID=UPI0030069019
MLTKYSVLFFFLALVNEKYIAFIQYRSLTDKSHCSKPLRTIDLRYDLDAAEITWQGGIIEDCSINVKPLDETDNLRLELAANNIPCDKNVTVSFVNSPLGDHKDVTYVVGCNVNPVMCMVFKSNVMITVNAPHAIATQNDLFRLRLEIIVSLLPKITEDVSTVTSEHLVKNYDGVCQLPVDRPDVYFLAIEYCVIYKCSIIDDCIASFNWDIQDDFKILRFTTPDTPRLYNEDNHDYHDHHELPTTESKLDVNSIIAIIGGVVTSLLIPIILLVVRRKMQTPKNETVTVNNDPEQEEDEETQNNRQSLISEESFQTI